ncbi:acetoin reductase family [Pyrrhoderma noxium]|uniref:Acetoin reductase family n=1 Tax=Pyrrhoderma noxium TaxID=2282107 RepID=A0A286UEX8_9AGAM|nr:acetoin reductase family [Pyrrhoderma noxium]
MSSKGVAIVTGSARGIGRGISLRLAADGYDLTLNDVAGNKEELESLVKEISAAHPNIKTIFVCGDVSQEQDVQNIVNTTVNELGSVDVMVANAGIANHSPITDMEVEKWDKVFNVNVRGTMLCYKYAARQMIKQGRGGRIIGAASNVAKQGMANASGYSATKFAIRGLTQSVALELGKYGITVNAYAPGAIDTQMFDMFDEYYTKESNSERLSMTERFKNRVALRRLGTPEDVAALVSFLASKDASFITGQSILTEGGALFD